MGGRLAEDTAADLALALALLDLVGRGFVVGRRESTVGAAVVSAVTTALGLVVVALEVLIH